MKKVIRILYFEEYENKEEIGKRLIDIQEVPIKEALLKNGSFIKVIRDRMKEAIENKELIEIEYK